MELLTNISLSLSGATALASRRDNFFLDLLIIIFVLLAVCVTRAIVSNFDKRIILAGSDITSNLWHGDVALLSTR